MEMLEKYASFILERATALGADKAVCSVAQSTKREFNVDGGKFSLFRTVFSDSVSITVFVGGKKGSVSLNKFDEESLERAVEECIASAESAVADTAWEIAEGIGEKHFYKGVYEPDTEKLFFRCRELTEDIAKRHPKIMMEQMIVSHDAEKRLYRTTTGNSYYTVSGFYEIDLMYSAHEGEKASSFFGSSQITAELDRPFIELGLIDTELSAIENQIDTTPASGKYVGRVIFAPGCFASDVIGTVCGAFAGDTVILDGTSLWKNKLSQRVADKRLTVSFKPSDSRIVCKDNYSGEGYISEDFDFIRGGVLQGFMISQYVANKTGFNRAPNSGANLVVEPGTESLDDIIARTEHGLLVMRFSGGNPGSNGEFSGVAKNSFHIEDGKIASAAGETMISGNLAEMLCSLAGISSEFCADGLSVVPYVAFDGITISGK